MTARPATSLSEPEQPVAPRAQILWLILLDNAEAVLTARRVQNSAAAEPKSDVVRRLAVGDEITRLELADLRARACLLVGIPRNEPPDPPVVPTDKQQKPPTKP